MPKKAKENKELKDIKKEDKPNTNITKKAPTKKNAKITKSTKTTKTDSAPKNATKRTTKKSSTSTNATKKESTSTTSSKNKTKKANSTSTKKAKKATKNIVEYYDLPQKYNKTVVKVLAQTPKTLFVYWEISDEDIEKYKKQYGENFFETTKPVLIIHNDTLNYSFEVEINDFANSWYLHVNDSKSDYRIELGRRPIQHNENIKSDYIYVSTSNEIESPNDHILFNTAQKMVYFRNVKTNTNIEKPISTLSFIKNMGKIHNIYDLYQELYKNEDNLEDLSNPSSNTSS